MILIPGTWPPGRRVGPNLEPPEVNLSRVTEQLRLLLEGNADFWTSESRRTWPITAPASVAQNGVIPSLLTRTVEVLDHPEHTGGAASC